jgi:hypothetical protein
MHGLLERDYDAMAITITGVVRRFADVMKVIGVVEQRLKCRSLTVTPRMRRDRRESW